MSYYKHIFFDLDKTLWDIYRNAKVSLEEIYVQFKLEELGVNDLNKFILLYNHYNDFLWEQYRLNKVNKNALRTTRFKYTLRDFGIKNNKLTSLISEYFYFHTPRRGMLIKDSKVVLEYLKPKYKLHIITNGFDDVQYLKLQFAGIHSFFENIITSDLAKSKKPNPDIFSFSLKQVNAIKEDCLMIGDDIIADCVGSKEFGIDQVYFNPDNISHNYNFTYEISNLIQLKEIL